MLHIHSCNAEEITDKLTSFISSACFHYRKMVGQAYDCAPVFSGVKNDVPIGMRVHAAHSLYIHCACHRLQLVSIQAADKVPICRLYTDEEFPRDLETEGEARG